MTPSLTRSRPPLPWRLSSMALAGSVSVLSRLFMFGLNRYEITGLDGLLGVLDRRRREGRERGLLTVSNHVGVLDDPLMWAMLPVRYSIDLENVRWGLGAHDICFKNRFTSLFFSLGQVLPTQRLWHSKHGGIYQPTMNHAIGLLSGPRAVTSTTNYLAILALPRYSTNGVDSFRAPTAYSANRGSWVHSYPEACCHQGDNSSLRYFKWGVSRLILEAQPAPEFIPMFVDGTQRIMPEDRGPPRWAPRIGNHIRMVIGEPTDVDQAFGQYRERWNRLAKQHDDTTLRDHKEAVQLRIEVAKAVRDEVAKLRERMGFPPEEDETAALAESWSQEPNKRRFKSPVDGSLVNRR